MAIFRKIHVGFWRDCKVLEELTPEDKLFFLYILTNPATTQIGVYKITKKQMAFELGYSMESVNSLMDRFENHHKLIRYNKDTRELAINMWGKYNLNRGGKPMIDCIEKELNEVKDKSLIGYVGRNIENVAIRDIFNKYLDKSVNDVTYGVSIGLSQQEKEEEKEQEEDKYKEKEEEQIAVGRYVKSNIGDYANLYEENIGLINGICAEWLIEVSESIDVMLFKKALEIATNNGSCNRGYVNGIVKKWRSNNIKSLEDLNAYKLGQRNQGGEGCGRFKRDTDKEEQDLYRKPTEEELREFRKYLEENTKL
ncbi:DnaD domain protein [Paraclostridium bifermentans]|uniref:DnaD domain protein n=1 Tax=Paraclostridium bifermentans TaxID=1490 RepID=UPI00359C5DDC